MIEKTELWACPFCGGHAELHHVGNYHTKKRVSVIDCKTSGCFATARVGALVHSFEWMDAEVIKQWHRRHLLADVEKVLGAVRMWDALRYKIIKLCDSTDAHEDYLHKAIRNHDIAANKED